MNRVLGKIEKGEGPSIVCVAGIHGNEQVGIMAFEMVFDKIREHKIDFNGRLLGLLGNKSAVAINKRFIDYDLNRVWTEEKIGELWKSDRAAKTEDEELKELKYYIDGFFDQVSGRKVLIDLHATSSEQGNFIVIPEDESNHPIVKALHQPIVINLEKYIEGTLLNYYHKQGVVSFAFEGGLIGSPRALEVHEAGLWEILKVAGTIEKHDHPWEEHYKELLKNFNADFPNRVKVLYRHIVEPLHQFRMKAGYKNFQPIQKGEYLADSIYGPVHAPIDGLIFMPLYQQDGNDGFFIVTTT